MSIISKTYKVGDFVTFYKSFEIAGEHLHNLDDDWEAPFANCDVLKEMLVELDKWDDNQIASIDSDGDFKFKDFPYTWPIEIIKGLSEDQRTDKLCQ